MPEKKYTETELIEGGKTMMESNFRFVDVFKWVKERTPDNEEMRARVLEKIKEDDNVKAKLQNKVTPPPKKIDYPSLITGIAIMAIGYALHQMMLSAGWIVGIVVVVMIFGFLMAFQAVFKGK